MVNGYSPSKEGPMAVTEEIEYLNDEADEIRKTIELRRYATQQNLATLAEMLEQFSKETPVATANTN